MITITITTILIIILITIIIMQIPITHSSPPSRYFSTYYLVEKQNLDTHFYMNKIIPFPFLYLKQQ